MTAADPAPQPQQGAWGSTPIPDPTVLSTAAIAQAVASLTSYIDGRFDLLTERMNGVDKATDLRLQTIDHLPGLIDEKVGHLHGLVSQQTDSIQVQFAERDKRSEREAQLSNDAAFSASKEAVAAALTAQKEAAALQNEANAKAIDKSELATSETINKLTQLGATTNGALNDKIDDLKERIGRVESIKVGMVEQRTEGRQSNAAVFATIAAITGFILFAIAIIGLVIESSKAV